MFTGLIVETGKIISIKESIYSTVLTVSVDKILEEIKLGDSIAVNGCCLTVTSFDASSISFDLLNETIRLTSFKILKVNNLVNLEPSLNFNEKIGGHFVTGHIDATGEIETLEQRDKDYFLKIKSDPQNLKYIALKGCITIDGISLTVAEVDSHNFSVWIIPHTFNVTNLCDKNSGDIVNLEFDILAKYVERLMAGN